MPTGTFHHAVDLAFCSLLVEAIEAETVSCGWACGTGARDLLDGVDGVDEYAVWQVVLGRLHEEMWSRHRSNDCVED